MAVMGVVFMGIPRANYHQRGVETDTAGILGTSVVVVSDVDEIVVVIVSLGLLFKRYHNENNHSTVGLDAPKAVELLLQMLV